MLEEKIKQVMC